MSKNDGDEIDDTTIFLSILTVVMAIGSAIVAMSATESNYAALAIILMTAIASFLSAAVTRRFTLSKEAKAIDEAYETALAWKGEAETIWSNASDESPAKRGTVSASMSNAIAKRDNYTCTYCGVKGTEQKDPDGRTWHCDHLHPVSRGGLTNLSNLVLACSACNLSKGSLTGAEFIRKRTRQHHITRK